MFKLRMGYIRALYQNVQVRSAASGYAAATYILALVCLHAALTPKAVFPPATDRLKRPPLITENRDPFLKGPPNMAGHPHAKGFWFSLMMSDGEQTYRTVSQLRYPTGTTWHAIEDIERVG
ncbi:hypothetical protein ACTRXD_17410 [Nitrospira sp. T9]|uniref:hypothetical protein n=1 Tax=unclassified Nitrospira TaxID=2652172 RepID=UPI003F994D4C